MGEVVNLKKTKKKFNITAKVKVLEADGLGDLTYATAMALETDNPMIMCDTETMYAVLIMAQRYLNREVYNG